MNRKFGKGHISDLYPGLLFKVVEPTIFYKYSVNEYGVLKTSKSLRDSYILFLNKESRENDIIRLNFFHHQDGIVSRDIEMNTSLVYENDFFNKIIFVI